jgi:ABC-type iron transport system FetAB permease component
MASPDISIPSLILCFLLLAVPLAINYRIKLQITEKILNSVLRMTIQLFLVGVFLTFIFDLNNRILNLAWLLGMATVASYTAIRNVELKMEKLFLPVILSFTAANLSVLLYFNKFVLDLGSLLEARYLIPIGGMLLGNALSAPADSCKHCNSRPCLSARNDDRADPGRCKSSSCDQIPDIHNDCHLCIYGNERNLQHPDYTPDDFR